MVLIAHGDVLQRVGNAYVIGSVFSKINRMRRHFLVVEVAEANAALEHRVLLRSL